MWGRCKTSGLETSELLPGAEEIFGFGEVDILEKSDGQWTPNQFPHKSPQQRDPGKLALRKSYTDRHVPAQPLLEVVFPRVGVPAARLTIGCLSVRQEVG